MRHKFDNWVKDIVTRRPDTTLIICGDFNSVDKPVSFLYNINDTKQNTYKRKMKTKERSSLTDWILCNQQLKHDTKYIWTSHSDHCLIESNLQIEVKPQTKKYVMLPNKKNSLSLCMDSEQYADSLYSFIQIQQSNKQRFNIMNIHRIRLH